MTLRFIYEQRFDKNHKEYWVKISAKTNKVIQRVSKPQKIKTFKKRQQSQRYRQKQVRLEKEFKQIAKTYNGNVADIRETYKKQLALEVKKERLRLKQLEKEGKKPYGRKRKSLKKDALQSARDTAGVVTVFRFWWVVKVGRDTPEVWAQQAEATNGEHFKIVKSYVNDISKPIMAEVKRTKGAVFVSGSGACVRLIDRETKRTVKQYELGAGCVRT